jgi:hypothetical protein
MTDLLIGPRSPAHGSDDMPFMVIYRNADGSAGYEEADAIDGAALFVERLRNDEAIDQIRLFRMEEITFGFRPYYKVELGVPDRSSGGRDAANVADRSNGNRLGLFQR